MARKTSKTKTAKRTGRPRKSPVAKSAKAHKTTLPVISASVGKKLFSLEKLESLTKNRLVTSLVIAGILVLILLAFPLRPLIIPAVVNGQPIFSWEYIAALHKKTGNEVLSQMIDERLVKQEVAKQGIQVSKTEIDSQIKNIEDAIGTESGGLDAMLALQGTNKGEFIEQMRLNLALEKLVKGTITISDEDIKTEISSNQEQYKALSELDAATSAAETIRQNKLREAFSIWFDGVKAKAKISNNFTNSLLSLPQLPSR